jgi:hypothetical protein
MTPAKQMALAAGLAIAATFTIAAPSKAQYEGPWCLQFSFGRSSAERCEFRSFEACAQERILMGSTAFCRQNSRYLPYWQGRGYGPAVAEQPVPKKRKHKHN